MCNFPLSEKVQRMAAAAASTTLGQPSFSSHATRHFFGATTFYQLATLPTVREDLSDLMLIQN